MKRFLDNAATTAVWPEVIKGLNELIENRFVNADSLYIDAVDTKVLLEEARKQIAKMLMVLPQEIIFTSGASEGNNMIIRGLIDFYQGKRRHLITSNIEHSSVSAVFDYYESIGYQVDRIPVDKDGVFDFTYFRNVLRTDTLLVSVMMVNNETGVCLPVEKIADYTKKNSMAFIHSDTTQALAKVEFSLKNIDFASFSAHKIGGVKGSGFVYKRRGTNLIPLIMGGQQEFSTRGGTSNYPVHILLAKTLKIALSHDIRVINSLKTALAEGIADIPGVAINFENTSPFICSLSFNKISSQILVNILDAEGFMVSGQSTCSNQKHQYSQTLKNMGFGEDISRNSIRVSFWYTNTLKEVNEFIQVLRKVVVTYGS